MSSSDLRFWTMPNILTLLRLGMLPFIVPLLLIGWGEGMEPTADGYSFDGDARLLFLAFFLSVFSETTDLTDGFIARKRNEVSRFGKLLDPLADSLTRIVLYMTFFAMGLIPLWMVFIFFVREHSVSYYRAFAANQGTVMAAKATGKVKSAVQVTSTLAAMLLLVVAAYAYPDFDTEEHRQVLLWSFVGGSVVYFAYIFAFQLRGWLLWLLVGLYPVGLAAFSVILWADLPAFDPAPLIWWVVFVAVLVTLWSFVDYTVDLVRSVRQASAKQAGESGGSEAP